MVEAYEKNSIFRVPKRIENHYSGAKYGIILGTTDPRYWLDEHQPEYEFAALLNSKTGIFVPLASEKVSHNEIKKLSALEKFIFNSRFKRKGKLRISLCHRPLIDERSLN